MQKERESSFELLRILCIVGIMFMHTFGPLNDNLSGFNRELSIFINDIFNTGVTCFILLSGYFGIRFDLAKLIRLDLVVIFYTLIGTLLSGSLSAKSLILSCIPILSNRYWFLTGYFALCFLSIFLNKFIETAKKETFRSVLILLIVMFYGIPTFLFYELIADGGKGIVNMVIVYLLGAYVKKYHPESFCKKRLLLALTASTLIIFIGNTTLSIIKDVQMGMFSRDNSLFILFSSVMLLLLFRELHFKSKVINHLAGNVMPLYVFEASVRLYITNRFFDLSNYTESPLLILYVAVYVLLTVIICMACNELRRVTFVHLDNWIVSIVMKIYEKASPIVQKLWGRVCTMVYGFLLPRN